MPASSPVESRCGLQCTSGRAKGLPFAVVKSKTHLGNSDDHGTRGRRWSAASTIGESSMATASSGGSQRRTTPAEGLDGGHSNGVSGVAITRGIDDDQPVFACELSAGAAAAKATSCRELTSAFVREAAEVHFHRDGPQPGSLRPSFMSIDRPQPRARKRRAEPLNTKSPEHSPRALFCAAHPSGGSSTLSDTTTTPPWAPR